jgi:hypothetical protein
MAGNWFTVKPVVTLHPVLSVYVIVIDPLAIPVATPVIGSMVATALLLLVHVPDAVALDKVVVEPIHVFGVPVIAAGSGSTVTFVVLIQPVPNE